MAEAEQLFSYVAIDAAGKRVKGQLTARDDGGAFERLKRDGLAPISLRAARRGRSKDAGGDRAKVLTERETAELLADLAALLKAGADMRSALGIIGARSDRPSVRAAARTLTAAISGGAALDQTFSNSLGKNQTFVGALVAAGEAAGDLAGGLQRGADMLQSRLRLQDQLVSTLSYPAFVFISTIAAVGVILLFVVPSLAPLVDEAGAHPPVTLSLMIAASNGLRQNALLLGGLAIALVIGAAIAGGLDLLTGPIERMLLDGPARRTTSGLVFGAFAIALGNMLAAGAPMSEALRLAVRSVRSGAARARLEPVAHAVRNGQPLSTALQAVRPFPSAIIRLVAVGEASGALGAMLARAGQMEEDAAIRRIEAAGRILGPALIVVLGGMIGLLMAGLLSGVSQLGDAALN
jgi:type II secretory pathway component PulF